MEISGRRDGIQHLKIVREQQTGGGTPKFNPITPPPTSPLGVVRLKEERLSPLLPEIKAGEGIRAGLGERGRRNMIRGCHRRAGRKNASLGSPRGKKARRRRRGGRRPLTVLLQKA